MPHSLRAKLGNLRYKKIISDKDYDRLCKALDNEGVLDKIRAEIEKLQKMCDKNDLNLMAQYSAFGMVLDIIDKYRKDGAKLSGGGE